MKRQILIGLGIMLVITAGLGVTKYFQVSAAIAEHAAMKMPPEAVTSMVTKKEPWPETLQAIGSLTAVQGVVLSSDTQGAVTKIHFESGSAVTAGAVILEIDSSVEEGSLKAAKARRDNAQRTYSRNQKLHSDSALSKAALEASEADFRAAEGEVASLEAQIAKKRIIAPFAGRLGVRRVNVGEYVSPGDEIIPLYDSSNLYVDFAVPQRHASKISLGLPVVVTVEGAASAEATLSSFDPQVDQKMRDLRARATLKSPSEALKPGMFAHVVVTLPGDRALITMPISGINYAPYGDTVFVVTDLKDPTGATYRGVRQQAVKLGDQRGNQVAILEGLNEGDEVVTTGTFKLRQGAAIAINNDFAPTNDAAPVPANS
jgi:membrane fusion protein (multidrug efflux system)